MRKILTSLGVIAFTGALALGATGAFFSDTETSTGNTFSAGDIDLQIDNESYVTSTSTGNLIASPANSWAMSNLTKQLFFSFIDLKPGDIGEDTISVHAGSNNAWACMAIKMTGTPENTLVDPETDAGDVGPALGNNGELQKYLNFTFWKDDGDNVFESGEAVIPALTGVASSTFTGSWLPIADSANGPALSPATTTYIGKAWCFGTLTSAPVAQDGLGKTGTNGPLVRGTGFTCSGAGNQNDAQTDGIVADVSFQAVQSRNNGQFLCSSLPPLGGGEQVIRPLVGALNYIAPVAPICNIIANDDGAASAGFTNGINAISTAIAQATPGQTICVAPGIYNEFTVNKSVTIKGLSDPEGGTPAVVVPSSASVTDLALVSTSSVTITGLKFDGTGTTFSGQTAGIRVSPTTFSLSGVNVTFNVIKNLASLTGPGRSVKGIQWFTDTNSGFTLSNSIFANNTIDSIASGDRGGYGIQTVGSMSNVAINNNTISSTTGGFGAGIAVDTKDTTLAAMSGDTITRNQVLTNVSNGTTRFAIQVENNINATGVAVHQNNIETLLHGGTNANPGTEGSLNAQSNWWGTAAPVLGTDVFVTGTETVDFTLPEASAFVLN